MNRLRASLRAIGAEVSAAVGALGQPAGAQRVLALPSAAADPVQRARRAQAQRRARRLLRLHAEVAERTQELTALVAQVGHLPDQQPGLPGDHGGAAPGGDGGSAALRAGGELRAVLWGGAARGIEWDAGAPPAGSAGQSAAERGAAPHRGDARPDAGQRVPALPGAPAARGQEPPRSPAGAEAVPGPLDLPHHQTGPRQRPHLPSP